MSTTCPAQIVMIRHGEKSDNPDDTATVLLSRFDATSPRWDYIHTAKHLSSTGKTILIFRHPSCIRESTSALHTKHASRIESAYSMDMADPKAAIPSAKRSSSSQGSLS